MTLGQKLQGLRRERGWTQEELAGKLDVSRQALSRWESDSALPDTKNVVQLARIFGVSTDYLLLEGAGRGPASEARRRRRRGDLPGAVTLILGAAGALLFEILTPVFDYRRTVGYAGTGRSETFEGMLAFMRYDRLGWLFALCLVLAIGGAVTLLAPRVKSALAWMLREGD